jgi:hypothetical protein
MYLGSIHVVVVDGGEVHRGDDLHEQDEASQGAQHHIRLSLREKLFHINVPAVLRIRIRDPVSF